MNAGYFNFNMTEVMAFSLVILRVFAFVVAWPVFGTNFIPNVIKVLFGFSLSLVLFPVIKWQGIEADLESMQFMTMAAREAAIGLCIGFLARMFFFAVSIAGNIMSTSFGLTGAQLINPSFNEYTTALDQFQILLATLFFLGINGHHLLISALHSSFDILPLGAPQFNTAAFGSLGDVVGEIVLMGLKMSAPVLVAILMMNAVMALMGRAVPQINVLITSLPVNIIVGLVVMLVALPLMVSEMSTILEMTSVSLFKFLRAL